MMVTEGLAAAAAAADPAVRAVAAALVSSASQEMEVLALRLVEVGVWPVRPAHLPARLGLVPMENGAAGGGGAALGGGIFVRGSNGAALTLIDGSIDAGNLSAGLGGTNGASFSTPGNDGSTCGTSMFLLGKSTTLSVSTGTQTIAGSICGWTGALPAITKTGSGTLVLASTLNSNLGPFEIGAGELRVNGLLPSTTVQVDSSGVFSGTGSATGTVTLLSGAQMSPGDASVAADIGALDIGTPAWNGGATIDFQLGAFQLCSGFGPAANFGRSRQVRIRISIQLHRWRGRTRLRYFVYIV